MLYTQQFIMPDAGTHRIGTIGGSPDQETSNGNRAQVGFQIPPRLGIAHVFAVSASDPRVLDCRMSVTGYSGRPLEPSRVPGRFLVELPCSVTVTGPGGVELIVEAWEVTGFQDRGAAQSFHRDAQDIASAVPLWASSVDFNGTGTLTFLDRTGATVGILTGAPMIGFSVPDGTATFTLTGAGALAVFRQGA